jgi:hypothetical protein
METWKRVPNFSKYFVSDLGNVKSFMEHEDGLLLKTAVDACGYVRIRIFNDKGYRKTWKMHRLVLYAFLGDSELQVNHKNGVKSDNKLSNLEYCTKSENLKHAYRIGIASNKGERHPNSKIKDSDAIKMRELYGNNVTQKSLSELYNLSVQTVSNIVNNKTWTHV